MIIYRPNAPHPSPSITTEGGPSLIWFGTFGLAERFRPGGLKFPHLVARMRMMDGAHGRDPLRLLNRTKIRKIKSRQKTANAKLVLANQGRTHKSGRIAVGVVSFAFIRFRVSPIGLGLRVVRYLSAGGVAAKGVDFTAFF